MVQGNTGLDPQRGDAPNREHIVPAQVLFPGLGSVVVLRPVNLQPQNTVNESIQMTHTRYFRLALDVVAGPAQMVPGADGTGRTFQHWTSIVGQPCQ